jgi:hypothetical protein
MASVAAPTEVAETIAIRLDAARVAHQDAQEIAAGAAATFRGLVIEAIEAGMRQADVAAIAHVSRARLHQIMVTEYSRA